MDDTRNEGLNGDLSRTSRFFEQKFREQQAIRRIWGSLKYARDAQKVFEAIIDTIIEETDSDSCSLAKTPLGCGCLEAASRERSDGQL